MAFKCMKFVIKGHKNILSSHHSTLEFTKEKKLSKRGNCIIGTDADFNDKEIREILKFKTIKIEIEANGINDSIICDVNPEFSNESQLVIRTSSFTDSRTLGINADKSSSDIKRKLVNYLKNPEHKAAVIITSYKQKI